MESVRGQTYNGGINKGIFKVGVARQQLLVQECGVFYVAEEGDVKGVGVGQMLELDDFEIHGENFLRATQVLLMSARVGWAEK